MVAREPLSVLRLERTDVRDSTVVVLIYSKGNGDLDLELVASEGENAWSSTSASHRRSNITGFIKRVVNA